MLIQRRFNGQLPAGKMAGKVKNDQNSDFPPKIDLDGKFQFKYSNEFFQLFSAKNVPKRGVRGQIGPKWSNRPKKAQLAVPYHKKHPCQFLKLTGLRISRKSGTDGQTNEEKYNNRLAGKPVKNGMCRGCVVHFCVVHFCVSISLIMHNLCDKSLIMHPPHTKMLRQLCLIISKTHAKFRSKRVSGLSKMSILGYFFFSFFQLKMTLKRLNQAKRTQNDQNGK